MSYAYDDQIYYDAGTVYYGDQAVASSEEYYTQATDIAATGEAPKNEEWMPFGVFLVTAKKGETKGDKSVQLSVNKEGAVQGAVYDQLTGKQTAIFGSVDKKTQRVAVKFEGNDSVVAEMGLYNLTTDEVPVLIHLGQDKQETKYLVRQQQPEAAAK